LKIHQVVIFMVRPKIQLNQKGIREQLLQTLTVYHFVLNFVKCEWKEKMKEKEKEKQQNAFCLTILSGFPP